MNIDASIARSYRRQAATLKVDEKTFRRELNDQARELFDTQPAEVNLPQRAYLAALVAAMEDADLPYATLKSRLTERRGRGKLPSP